MKNLVILVLAGLLFANVGFAVVDPDTNSMGFYFDANADVYEFFAPPFTMVQVYVILTNPDFNALIGYEFGYNIVGNYMLSGTILMGTAPIDVGGGLGNHIVGLAAPMPTTPATILCNLVIFLMDPLPVAFTLSGSVPSSVGSNLPAVLLVDHVITSIGTSSFVGEPLVNAYINGTGVVDIDEASWGQVKSLYR